VIVAGAVRRWSHNEELGHLIDSAANNHIRFALASLNGEFRGPRYAQDVWVALHGYQDLDWQDIVDTWYRYNSLLAHPIGRIPERRTQNRCVVGSTVVTLRFVIADYVVYMQHHIDRALSRTPFTPYLAPERGGLDDRSKPFCFRAIDSELQLDFKPRFCVRLDPVRRVAVS
jgi:hypothetical protein